MNNDSSQFEKDISAVSNNKSVDSSLSSHLSQKSDSKPSPSGIPTAHDAEKSEQLDSPSKSSKRSKKDKKSKKSKKSKGTGVSAAEGITDDNNYGLTYDGRTPEEIQILKSQINIPDTPITYFTLFRYATSYDVFLFIFSYFASIVSGAALPLFTLVMGGLTNDFAKFLSTGQNPDEFQNAVNHNTLYFLYLLIAITTVSSIETFISVDRGEVVTARIREHYIQAILRQNVGYFDKIGPGEITNRITSDINLIQEGISEKVNLIFQGFATFFAGIVIAFIRSWKLTLILLSTTVGIILIMGISSKFMMKNTMDSLAAFGKACSVAEDILSSIRTTTAFGIQHRLSKQYEVHVQESFVSGVKAGRSIMFMVACLWTIVYFSYALAFWQGARFIADGSDTPGSVITVFMCVVIGSVGIGGVAPAFQSVGKSVGAGKKVFEAIDRIPTLDSASDEGIKLDNVTGHIELKNVKFAYPSRPNVTVLQDFTLSIKPGQTVALVGASGSGKSTIIGIMERFYEYLSGSVTFDGVELKDLNIRWLRQQMALVSQEPTLFSVSIFQNIAYGLIGTPYEHASYEDKKQLVIKACEEANAWDFIQKLSDGLETNVGQSGFLLSGGQKQRIAIARAIVSQPRILLLDEATSALDTKSEGVVQDALDRASANRTTIVIAHRLSTIKDADVIVVMSHGQIMEQGTHTELLAHEGAYHSLVRAQNIRGENTPTPQDHEYEKPQFLTSEEVKSSTAETISRSKTGDSTTSAKSTSAKSASDLAIIDMQEKGLLDNAPITRSSFTLMRFLSSFTKGYNKIMYFGFFAALCTGVGYPIMSYIYGKTLNELMVAPQFYDHMKSRVNFYAGFFVLLGGLEFFCFCALLGLLTYHNQILVKAIRVKVFKHYLRMDIAYFDDENHSTGALTSTLSKDGQSVEGFGGLTLGQILNCSTTLFGGIIMAIVINWRLGLVCTACVPFLVGCGFCRIWVLTNLEEKSKKSYAESGQYACESVSSVRTVASLTQENFVCDTYKDAVENQVKKSRLTLSRSAILYGLSQGLVPGIMGLGFWFGATLIRKGQSDAYQFFSAFVAVVFGAQSAGQVFSYAPSMGKARQASQNVAQIFDVQPTIDPESKEGDVVSNVIGDIEFRNVHFRYPTRLHVPVLRGLNLTVKRGQYVALVGSSGCGKSTTIGLIEQFYRPLDGQVMLDGVDISTLNVAEYRKNIGLVQQEPVLYHGSIRDNILLGLDDEQAEAVTDEEIFHAAKKANIHDFIMSLPEGYETSTGSKGTLLSGGQKQRIAIARALIRNPKVLLLDEATSALDSESEKVVQAALDEAAKGRTTIAVAHRLSTIQNADIIYLFDKGQVAEAGTHEQLLARKGLYYQLVRMQDLESK